MFVEKDVTIHEYYVQDDGEAVMFVWLGGWVQHPRISCTEPRHGDNMIVGADDTPHVYHVQDKG